MMMTCRLLCALLLLALGCCPSACVAHSTDETIAATQVEDVKESTSSSTLSSESQVEDDSDEERGSGTGSSEDRGTKVPVTPGSSGAVTQSNEAEMPVQEGEKKGTTEDENGTTAPKSQSKGSTVEQGEADVGGGKSLTAPKRQSGDVIDTVHAEDGSTTGPKSRTSTSADQTDRETKVAAATTTTATTKSPTTTTTTTTTTEAPSTTTTEAPAVSTTSAPSRLREIDGSLSSSAWVCAPLVLAASALAYTTVG
ncbi:putative mucin TcMUCII [Trypanosoma cruzi]|uniref:Mucin TcMUCII, putative n=2 Tax=Trypanosoma cruzi TaxID=5693 RepID=Q4D9T8_TRYCC|nr:mucin TcMUCII, putative [Trypanosoma cruzi]EAN89295.1 mucin TcMUCII, putative [Trypanosoma cruzi]PWV14080.1 putative mucin TcMUCII [Trypanosoma cruzi]RNC34530.1 mucin TcMUCII [Trypanosoma cruzi]|eukprot:XP_811146.1 mucin TcMUCII [Trypanosoma cruzi strain CL Brener]